MNTHTISTEKGTCERPVGRFAPSPTGRMHLGNIFSALLSWLSVRSRGGRWILRIEDIDPQRSKTEYARMIEDDLEWLGLDFDEGGLEERGIHGPYRQSERSDIYGEYLRRLRDTGYTYPCTCTRADIMATQAPHQSDGRVIYGGRCRPSSLPALWREPEGRYSSRLYVPDKEICFNDRVYGAQSVNLTRECGDFILRRADGAWAYQLAVVVDDALMGVTEVVRGSDLLLSTGQQVYLCGLLGFPVPEYAHVPLICNAEGRRLSKRDMSLDMEHLRALYSRRDIIGQLAHMAGLLEEPSPCEASELTGLFTWDLIPRCESLRIV